MKPSIFFPTASRIPTSLHTNQPISSPSRRASWWGMTRRCDEYVDRVRLRWRLIHSLALCIQWLLSRLDLMAVRCQTRKQMVRLLVHFELLKWDIGYSQHTVRLPLILVDGLLIMQSAESGCCSTGFHFPSVQASRIQTTGQEKVGSERSSKKARLLTMLAVLWPWSWKVICGYGDSQGLITKFRTTPIW